MDDENGQNDRDGQFDVDRRTFLGGLGATAVASAVGCEDERSDRSDEEPSSDDTRERTKRDDRPNILFFWSDDQSAPDLGVAGNEALRTENLDQFAADGMHLKRTYVSSPQCSPSRSSLMTGRPPHSTNTARLHSPLRNQFDNVVQRLKEAGYYAGSYRKVHLGEEFMELWDFDGSAPGPFNHEDAEGVTFRTFFEERPEDQPFFLHVGLKDPHRPYEKGAVDDPHSPEDVTVPEYLPDTEAVRRDLARYYDEIARLDRDCGTILDLLEEFDLAENTLAVFSADNGIPFAGGKGTLYEPGIRVPTIARWPGKIEAGTSTEALVSLVDMPTTFLDIADAEPMERSRGKSLVPLLTGESDSHRDYVFTERNWHDNLDLIRAVITDRFKLIQNYAFERPYMPTLDIHESPSWKSIVKLHESGELDEKLERRYFESPRPRVELYDLNSDRMEMNNLAEESDHEKRVQNLQEVLSDWMLETDDYLPPLERAFGGLDLAADPITGPTGP